MSVTIQPLGETLGARITGVDLSADLPGEVFHRIYRAYLDRHLIAIPGQRLTEERLIAFSRRIGPLESHVLSQYHHPHYPEIMVLSNVVENGKPLGSADAGSYWHSDISYKARPSRATVLYALEIPAEGGDTLFADMVAAYEALPAELRRQLDGLSALHDYSTRNDRLAREKGIRAPLTDAQRAATPAVLHPAIRTHPESGRKALYVNPGFTVQLEGVTPSESRETLSRVFDHCLRDEFRLRYRWAAGDVVLWDNAAVMHCATAGRLLPTEHRTLWRTIVSGGTPY